jgi:hypothetical protein
MRKRVADRQPDREDRLAVKLIEFFFGVCWPARKKDIKRPSKSE